MRAMQVFVSSRLEFEVGDGAVGVPVSVVGKVFCGRSAKISVMTVTRASTILRTVK